MKVMFLTATMLMIIVAPAAWGQSTPRVTDSVPTIPTTSDVDVDQLTAQELRNKPVYDGKSEK